MGRSVTLHFHFHEAGLQKGFTHARRVPQSYSIRLVFGLSAVLTTESELIRVLAHRLEHGPHALR
jgi:hypothetical protein